jgi:GTP cyclohydrolase I
LKQNITHTINKLNQLDTLLSPLQSCDDDELSPSKKKSAADPRECIDSMKLSYLNLLQCINEDPNREGIVKTPHRAAKAFLELTIGYTQDLKKIVNEAIYQTDSQEMVIVKDIELYSLCEHHLLPFMGKCHVGYIPKGKVIGLSKVARIVDLYARRLQIQENLTYQIARCLEEVIGATGVAVVIEAEHMCMRMRGVGKQNSVMTTSANLGVMKDDPKTRSEFLTLIQNRK